MHSGYVGEVLGDAVVPFLNQCVGFRVLCLWIEEDALPKCEALDAAPVHIEILEPLGVILPTTE